MFAGNNYKTNFNQNFRGSVRSSELYNNCLKEYVRSIKVGDENWGKLNLFINTIRFVKNDGSKKELIVDTNKSKRNIWYVKYGDYYRKEDTSIPVEVMLKTKDRKQLGKDVFDSLIVFGKDYFGIRKLSKTIDEFVNINRFLKQANIYAKHARLPKNKLVADRLLVKSKMELVKAEKFICNVREDVLNSLST